MGLWFRRMGKERGVVCRGFFREIWSVVVKIGVMRRFFGNGEVVSEGIGFWSLWGLWG